MPIYTYQCDDCMLEFDRFNTIKNRRLYECPECNKMVQKVFSTVNTSIDTKYKDLCGQPIWFPKDGKPYYDRTLKKTFYSKAEKCEYLKEKRLVMDGSSNPKNWPLEAGDTRSKSYRKENRMED